MRLKVVARGAVMVVTFLVVPSVALAAPTNPTPAKTPGTAVTQPARTPSAQPSGTPVAQPSGAAAAQPAASAPAAPPPTATPAPQWAVVMDATPLYSAPDDTADQLGNLAAWAPLQILGYAGDFAHVRNPRGQVDAYVPADLLGPSDPPSKYVTMAPPPLTEAFDERGVVTDTSALSVYPTPADEAVDHALVPNTWLNLAGEVQGDDGNTWYQTADGDFVPAAAVFVPDRSDEYVGHWLDVDLTTPARVTAYEGQTPVNSFLTIKGAGPRPTPTGTFTILRRVADETMDSSTIGIPRNGPGGYYLTGVLFTQYFTNDGASLHYNYWSSNWGYPGSHGCLGLSYANSAWLWDWASIGTPVSIHY